MGDITYEVKPIFSRSGKKIIKHEVKRSDGKTVFTGSKIKCNKEASHLTWVMKEFGKPRF
ncbi:MAG: hypothetical protein NT068_02720 [Candidatus Nomurabacteria bacterium]|nr:hypothetical protein [Candidatus Nomurabacteria bacterium]